MFLSQSPSEEFNSRRTRLVKTGLLTMITTSIGNNKYNFVDPAKFLSTKAYKDKLKLTLSCPREMLKNGSCIVNQVTSVLKLRSNKMASC